MLSSKDFDELEERLRHMIHVAFDEFRARSGQITFVHSTRADHDNFLYTWPNQTHPESFTHGGWYSGMSGNEERGQFLVALTEREAWGRIRPRYVTFLQGRGKNSTTIYPLTEFVQVDRPGPRHFAAKIPNPQQPSKFLQEGDPIPPELVNAVIRTTQELFDGVQEAKTLRRVVDLNNNGVQEILRHAYWIGRLKNRL